MRYSKKMNRYEREEFRKKKLETDLHGEGRYLYENIFNADLQLPKPDLTGNRHIAPRGKFEGDNYFFRMLGKELRLIKVIEQPQPKGINMQKLILDQPETITNVGRVEHHVASDVVPLNDNEEKKKDQDVLLIELPIDGVDILLD